nr:transcriptional-regulating factor 1-like [Pelodiscus sinensis]|eukprot:XP_025037983.1 transcriptional-regulating factor 1-like [Pelodiscus sinensis]
MHRATSSPHYTPPPMLNPLRQGTGLFAELGASLGDGSPDRLRRLDTPQINVGPAFQPVLPVLQDPHLAWLPPPQAEPVWRPWPRLEQDAETQRQGERQHWRYQVEELFNRQTSMSLIVRWGEGRGSRTSPPLWLLWGSVGRIQSTLTFVEKGGCEASVIVTQPLARVVQQMVPEGLPSSGERVSGPTWWLLSGCSMRDGGIPTDGYCLGNGGVL